MFISTPLLRPRKAESTFMNAFAFLLFLGVSASSVSGQPPSKVWDKTIGGNSFEDNAKVITTADGGYMLAGWSMSDASGEKSENSKGSTDYWIIKLNSSGVKQWDKTIGGSGDDYLSDIRQTSDGGYILAGSSQSSASGDKSENVSGGSDAWIVKLSPIGSIEWENTIGGNSGEGADQIHQTADGGYIFISQSYSGISGDKSEASRGSSDLWVVKLNADGSKAWDRTYGGSNYEMFPSISLTADGGYIIGSTSGSGISGDKTESSFGGEADYWIVKLSSTGAKEWDRAFGGDDSDALKAVAQTRTGEYLLAGESRSSISGNKSADHVSEVSQDFWVVKLDVNGNKIWDKTYGRGQYERLSSLALTFDGGFVLGGSSFPSNPSGPFDLDYWIVKLASDGDYQWNRAFAGPGEDILFSVETTPDRGYVLAGYSDSGVGPDKSQNNNGERDFWIIKLATDPLPVTLAAFSASKEGSTALLQWKTTSETASNEFEIQHSINGKQWNAIGSVAAAGDSNTDKTYYFTDYKPADGQNNLYRLKMIDIDGSFAFSSVKSLSFGPGNAGRIYPNPAPAGQLTVDVKDWGLVENVQISTANALKVYDSGRNPQPTVEINHLPSGIYVLKVLKKNGTSEQFRFVR